MLSEPLQRVLEKLRGVREMNGYYMALCPAHDDHHPSLSVTVGQDGCVLLKCHAGCETPKVVKALDLKFEDLSAAPGAASAPPASGQHQEAFASVEEAIAKLKMRYGKPAQIWNYENAKGQRVGVVVRWDQAGGTKAYRPISLYPDGWRLKGMPQPRPLYHLLDLLAADRIFVCEGEKAADAVQKLGLVATTSPHGAQSAASADWQPLARKEVVILPDRDKPGEKYASDVAKILLGLGARVRIVRLCEQWINLPTGGDMADVEGDPDSLRASLEQLVQSTSLLPDSGAEPVQRLANLIRMSDVQSVSLEWLWTNRFPLGKVAMIAGDPGLGKSFVTLDIAGRVSSGTGWPDGADSLGPPAGVVLLSAEDDPADTIRPRLMAAGANLENIQILQSVKAKDPQTGHQVEASFNLARDLEALEDAIQRTSNCRLVIIDPISAYLVGVDSHNNSDLRGLLAPLAQLAQKYRVAVVLVSHLNKGAGGPAMYRITGSLAFVAAARIAWLVVKDCTCPSRRLFLLLKSNLSETAKGMAYEIKKSAQGGPPQVWWEADPVTMTIDEVLGKDPNNDDRGERDEAEGWLQDQLSGGAVPAREILKRGREIGLRPKALRRALRAIGGVSRKADFEGGWNWSLGTAQDQHHEDDQDAQGSPA